VHQWPLWVWRGSASFWCHCLRRTRSRRASAPNKRRRLLSSIVYSNEILRARAGARGLPHGGEPASCQEDDGHQHSSNSRCCQCGHNRATLEPHVGHQLPGAAATYWLSQPVRGVSATAPLAWSAGRRAGSRGAHATRGGAGVNLLPSTSDRRSR
jgi:hypothetical protein